MLIVAQTGRITLVNRKAEALVGYARSERLGIDVSLLVPTRFRTDQAAATEVEFAVQSMKAGANGMIPKHHASDEVLAAIRSVTTGGTYLLAESAMAVS